MSAQLTSSKKHDGEKSPFIRIGKGIFALKNLPVTVFAPASTPVSKHRKLENLAETDIEYIQDNGPELKEREIKNTLRAIEQKMRGDS